MYETTKALGTSFEDQEADKINEFKMEFTQNEALKHPKLHLLKSHVKVVEQSLQGNRKNEEWAIQAINDSVFDIEKSNKHYSSIR